MKEAKAIDVCKIREVLLYDPNTGDFYWKKNFHKSKVGKPAGTTTKRGYIYIKVDGRLYHAARLALALSMEDFNPDLEVDHINRVRNDNRLVNLRQVSPSQNCYNRSTFLGEVVPRYYTKHRTGKYQVQVRDKYIGLFSNEADAKQAVARELLDITPASTNPQTPATSPGAQA